jgi:hypothetical protein
VLLHVTVALKDRFQAYALIELLLSHGADVNLPAGKYGAGTALQRAIRIKSKELFFFFP